jgi:hypothetical protein
MFSSHKSNKPIEDLRDFQKTMKELEDFKKMMELVRKFPIKPMRPRKRQNEWDCKALA